MFVVDMLSVCGIFFVCFVYFVRLNEMFYLGFSFLEVILNMTLILPCGLLWFYENMVAY